MSKSIYMDLVYGKEVTMARAGTLPDFLYQKEIEVGERIDLSSNSMVTTDISSVSSITERVYYKGSYIP